MWIKTGYKDYERTTGYRKKDNQLKSSKSKAFFKCIFRAFEYHPTCRRLLRSDLFIPSSVV